MGKATKIANVPNAPAFSAYRGGSTQSFSSGSWIKMQFRMRLIVDNHD